MVEKKQEQQRRLGLDTSNIYNQITGNQQSERYKLSKFMLDEARKEAKRNAHKTKTAKLADRSRDRMQQWMNE